jgi:hypothetical protein
MASMITTGSTLGNTCALQAVQTRLAPPSRARITPPQRPQKRFWACQLR